MLAGANLRQAQTYWRAVEGACSTTNANAANGALMTYIDYLRDIYPAGFIQVAGQESNFLNHINSTFVHVGYAAPALAGGASGPLQGGALGVLPASGSPNEIERQGFGAMTLVQGDGLGHLIAMYPTGVSCLTVGNLNKVGNCVEVAAFPTLSTTASPAVQVKVGICFPEGTTGGALGLGHETGGRTEVAGQLAYPEDCHPAEELAGSWTGGVSGIMKRLASIGSRTFGVSKAYASHAGLGGIGEALSPWGGLDLLVFAGSFNAPHVVGSPPVTTGTFGFTMDVTAPGSILVQSSLGEYTGPLVVLKQAGGNCGDACGRLLFQANLHSASSSAADEGVYDVSWISLQTAPGVKEAPFVISDSDGRVIAKLSYVTRQSSNELYYNDTIFVGNWERNKPLTFKVRVDLDNPRTTTLYMGATAVTAVAAATNRPFHNTSAANLASVAADFRGIDSGTMGWDEIGVQRLPDR